MKKFHIFLIFLWISSIGYSQNKPAYQIFNASGKKVTYHKMLKEMSKADIVLFGELHNNPIAHWLQIATLNDLNEKRLLTLGAEMFEADNQHGVDEYVAGKINSKELGTLVRLWNNFSTDYKPLLDFAKKNQIKFIATNIPRTYANLVYKNGFQVLDTVPMIYKKWIAPLPIEYDATLPGYQNMIKMAGGHGGDNLPKAQAIKDATMAHFILQNREKDKLFIHYNGTYHSDFFEGIGWYLKRKDSNLNIVTIATSEQENLNKIEKDHKNKATFIIIVDAEMTKTY
ncbi:MAG: ChaN family lipoprotein [Flavobacteriaceae bacterium]|nr:ChaN family lipoprotein [Flavobacteriaceae bacterium]